ncbi:MAG: AraC family transcriptional regulator [Planctomycetota bacterium]
MDEANISAFSGCQVFRFNHIPHHRNEVRGRFRTYAINYAHAGELYWSAGGGPSVALQAPVAFWTWPGPEYRYAPVKGGEWDHYFVSWTGPRARSWQRTGLLPRHEPQLALRAISDPNGMQAAFRELHGVLAESPHDHPLVVHLLEGLLLRVQSQRPRVEDRSLIALVQETERAVRLQPGQDWDFSIEAQRLGCTPVHFRRLWKSLTGMPPVAFLSKTRLDRAAALLRANRLTINQIASEVGYDDVGYFSRQFKQAKGMPPGAYRRDFQMTDTP